MQRKTFRVEKMFAARHAASPAASDADQRHIELIGELKALRVLAERRGDSDTGDAGDQRRELEVLHDSIKRTQRELAALHGGTDDGPRTARAVRELIAVATGMEKATQQILKATEVIDESAKALVATVKDDYKRGVAQDIQDHAARIYEACNFQDLTGQRINNVATTLKTIETHVDRVIDIWGGVSQLNKRVAAEPVLVENRRLVNGPKLDGDNGHASQGDIDAMFD